MRKVYLDSSATTYVASEVINEMLPCFNTVYGNSNSLHGFGRDAINLVDKSRDRIAKVINCKSSNLYFTSSGTESNNLAILGIARANKSKGNHIIVSAIEHESILESCKQLEKEGFKVTYIGCSNEGVVSVAQLLRYITKNTMLVSVMSVNNETGTIQHVKALAKVAHDNGAIFHTDAVQALGQISLDVKDMEIDAMSISSHKIYGPKGVGALYVNENIKFDSITYGGNHEHYKRAGTLNVAGIVGFGKAVEVINRDMIANNQKLKVMRDYFVKHILENIENVQINGHPVQKINKVVSISFDNATNESLATLLDLNGIAVSYGSACNAGTFKQSHVLKAMNLDDRTINSTIRFSFAKNVTKDDLDYVVEKLVECVKKLRELSPLRMKKEEE